MDSHITTLKAMGFSEEVSRKALATSVWDVNKALDMLLTKGAVGEGLAEPSLPSGSSSSEVWPEIPKGTSTGRAKAGKPDPAASRSMTISDLADNSTTASAPSVASSPRTSEKADRSPKARIESESPDNLASQDTCEDVDEQSGSAETSRACLEDLASTDVADRAEVRETCRQSTEAEATEAVDAPAPRKRILQVLQDWHAEADVLGVKAGDFLKVWIDSESEHGWIFAEKVLTTDRQAGWLPSFLCPQLPDNKRWLLAIESAEAVHSTQLRVEEGHVLQVLVESRTPEGWVYAEDHGMSLAGKRHDAVDAPGSGRCQAGWVPDRCLQWQP